MEDEDFDRDDIEIDYDDYGGYGWTGEDDEDIDSLVEDICPNCGSDNVHRNEHDFLVCDDCGYEEVPKDAMGICERCGTDTPEALLINGICPACVDEIEGND